MILHAGKVESYFGYWPDYSDGKVVLFSYQAHSSIILSIAYGDVARNRRAVIRMRFGKVSEVSLSELRSENVIDVLHISDGNLMTVNIQSTYGLEGSFNCETVEVLEVQPDLPFEKDC